MFLEQKPSRTSQRKREAGCWWHPLVHRPQALPVDRPAWPVQPAALEVLLAALVCPQSHPLRYGAQDLNEGADTGRGGLKRL